MINPNYILKLLYLKGIDTQEVVLISENGISLQIWQTHFHDHVVTDYVVYLDGDFTIFKTFGEALEFYSENVLGEELDYDI